MATLPPTWLKFDSDYTDSGSNGFNGAAGGSGNSFDTTNKQQGTASLLTDGNGYATFGDNIDLMGNDAITISFWFKCTTGAASNTFISKCTSWGPHTNKGWSLVWIASNTNMYWQMNAGTSYNVNEMQAHWNVGNIRSGTWHHLVLVKTTGSAYTDCTLYLDNSVVSSSGNDANNLTAGGDCGNAVEVTVGAQGNASEKFTGNIDSIKILKGTIWSAGDVSTEYNDPNQTYGSPYTGAGMFALRRR